MKDVVAVVGEVSGGERTREEAERKGLSCHTCEDQSIWKGYHSSTAPSKSSLKGQDTPGVGWSG